MPELREVIAHCLTLRHVLTTVYCWSPSSGAAWGLLAIWADPTKAEVKGLSSYVSRSVRLRMEAKVPFKVSASVPAPRGRGRAWSPLWLAGTENLADLQLRDVTLHPRALVLDFTSKYLSFHFGTHTSIQVYSVPEWRALKSMPQEGRAFKFALVLEFKHAVIAFLSLDLIFRARWLDESPEPPVTAYPFENPETLDQRRLDEGEDAVTRCLQVAADWLRPHLDARGTARGDAWGSRLAMDVFCELGADGGMYARYGVYSTSEAWHFAGLAHTLTAAEVFFCPSRFARLWESCLTFAQDAWECLLEEYLRPALHGSHLLAPTEGQRLNCARRFFRVWARDKIYVSHRMADIRKECAYDVFEPTYIEDALDRPNNLGHLIFGSLWKSSMTLYSPSTPVVRAAGDDPLTSLYREFHLLNTETFLDEDAYAAPSRLFLPPRELRARCIPVLCYKQSGKVVWSITNPEYNGDVELLHGDARKQRLAETIIRTTETVSVGPLEYCGNALAFNKAGRGKRVHIALCKGDPTVRLGRIDFYARHLTRLSRAKGSAVIPGKRKKSMRELAERKARSTGHGGRIVALGLANLRRKLKAHHNMQEHVQQTNRLFSEAERAETAKESVAMSSTRTVKDDGPQLIKGLLAYGVVHGVALIFEQQVLVIEAPPPSSLQCLRRLVKLATWRRVFPFIV
ncbi:hypothetical protein AURDEDRAFT_161567 [Auricularia subglabra TFB-10046 SS5]|nr:hypothetical protein AURDEDRAFT_161567 [Auricularia subglabra TFB-10046 SS5]